MTLKYPNKFVFEAFARLEEQFGRCSSVYTLNLTQYHWQLTSANYLAFKED